MKLVRYGAPGQERPGIVSPTGQVRDVGELIGEFNFAQRPWHEVLGTLLRADLHSLPVVRGPMRFGVPIAGVGKIVCAGMNYSDHCEELGVSIPTEPAIFMKPASALCGPDDDVRMPPNATKLDWEVELAVVIGARASNVSIADAGQYIAGYTIMNDVSERAFQLERGGQWVKGKACDTFAPVGPWLVTPEEIRDPHDLEMSLDVNGHPMQRGNTSRMIFGINFLIHYISQFMSLEPGDIVSTGTPPGVGMGLKPQRFLQREDQMKLAIAGLGSQCQRVV